VSGAGHGGQTALFTGFALLVFFQSVVRALFAHPGKIGQRLAAQGAVDEEDHQQRKSNRRGVEKRRMRLQRACKGS
jgi:hypothetical protein